MSTTSIRAATDSGASDAPEMISGGHLVAKALKNEGVDTIFTLCGGHIIDIYDGCIDEGIKIIDVRHEQVAAHAADGYARMTGGMGCAVVTAGPGTTNTVTGIANAFRAESPMLLIGGQAALSQHRMGGLQDLAHVDMMRPITKFATSVPSTERIADFIGMAAREAFNGSFGPSYLEIPRDVLDLKVDLSKAVIPKPGMYRASTKSIGDPAGIEALADLIVHAKKPAILLGQQVWTCRGTDIAREFVEKLNIPTYMNGAGRGTLGPGPSAELPTDAARCVRRSRPDVIVGTPFDFRLGYGKSVRSKTVVQIDMSYATVGKNRDISTRPRRRRRRDSRRGPASDVRPRRQRRGRAQGVGRLAARQGKRGGRSALAETAQRRQPDPSVPPGVRDRPVPHRELDLRRRRRRRRHVRRQRRAAQGAGPVDGSGSARHARRRHRFAMAAKLANPTKEVVALFGDGSFAMTGFDIQTAIRFKLPYIAIIGNNSYMNQIRYGQIQKYGPERGNVGNYLGDINFEKFADMLDIHGEAVRDPKEIRPALERARASGTCAIINVWLDPNAYAPGTENQTMYK